MSAKSVDISKSRISRNYLVHCRVGWSRSLNRRPFIISYLGYTFGAMAPIVPSSGGDAPADDLDNLFDYHVDLENVFRDVDVNMDMPGGKQSAQSEPKVNRPELGIDEEVKITRKRQPVPKLDEDRWALSLAEPTQA